MTPASRSRQRGILLLALGGVIVKLLITGQMSRYIAPALDPLSAVTATVLAVMGVVEVLPRRATRAAAVDAGEPPSGAEEALTALLITLVVAIGLLVAPRALGSAGLAGERLDGLLLRYGPGGAPGATTLVLDDFDALLAALRRSGPASLGRRVRVTGTVLAADDLAPGELALLRYQVAHCVADARPLAILVAAPGDMNPGTLQPERWIQVEGTLAVRERGGDRVVAIEATRIAPIDEPANPYLTATRSVWEPR